MTTKEKANAVALDLPCGFAVTVRRTAKPIKDNSNWFENTRKRIERAFEPDRMVERAIFEIGHHGVSDDYARARAPTQSAPPLADHVERDRSRDLPRKNATSRTGHGWKWIGN